MYVKTNEYCVEYDSNEAIVKFQGTLRLSGLNEYMPIAQLLNDVIEQNPSKIILDLRALNLLNSSGINTLSRFVIRIRQHEGIHMIVRGNPTIPWHEKSIKNLQRLMPSLCVEIDG